MTNHDKIEVGGLLIALVIAGTGFAALLWCTTPYSLGLSPDSISYLSTANSIMEGSGSYLFNGEPYCQWPPLLPLVICIVHALGFDAVAGMRVVNAAAFVLLVALAFDMLRRFVPSKLMLALGLCTLLSSTGIFQVSCYLWSENLFILLVLLFLWIASRHSSDKDCWNPFIGGTVVALSILTRWIGVTVFLTGLTLLLTMRTSSLLKKLKRVVIFSFVALAPVTFWIIHNLSVCSSPVGSRGESSASLYEYLREFSYTVSQWFLPADFFPLLAVPLLIVLSLAFGFGLFRRMRRIGVGRFLGESASIAPLLLFCVSYSLILPFSSLATAADLPNIRLLSPLYIPSVILLLVGLYELVAGSGVAKRIVRISVFLVLSCWAAFCITQSIQMTASFHANGVGGISTRDWHSSCLIDYLRRNSLDGVTYSNAPEALYFYLGLRARLTPQKYLYNSPKSTAADNLDEFLQVMGSGQTVYVIWFDSVQKQFLYKMEELASHVELNEVVDCSDGLLYLLRQKPTER